MLKWLIFTSFTFFSSWAQTSFLPLSVLPSSSFSTLLFTFSVCFSLLPLLLPLLLPSALPFHLLPPVWYKSSNKLLSVVSLWAAAGGGSGDAGPCHLLLSVRLHAGPPPHCPGALLPPRPQVQHQEHPLQHRRSHVFIRAGVFAWSQPDWATGRYELFVGIFLLWTCSLGQRGKILLINCVSVSPSERLLFTRLGEKSCIVLSYTPQPSFIKHVRPKYECIALVVINLNVVRGYTQIPCQVYVSFMSDEMNISPWRRIIGLYQCSVFSDRLTEVHGLIFRSLNQTQHQKCIKHFILLLSISVKFTVCEKAVWAVRWFQGMTNACFLYEFTLEFRERVSSDWKQFHVHS